MKVGLFAWNRFALRPKIEHRNEMAEKCPIGDLPTSVSLVLDVLIWAASSSTPYDV